jgi:hypothetical protein
MIEGKGKTWREEIARYRMDFARALSARMLTPMPRCSMLIWFPGRNWFHTIVLLREAGA